MLKNQDPSLYNEDLAPIPESKRTWGWFEIFNVWSNDIQSLFGYTLAASLFLSFGLGGWTVFAVSLLISSFMGGNGEAVFLQMSSIDWISFLSVWLFQIWLFWNGIDWITKFLNLAGPFVYVTMIALALVIWGKAGDGLIGYYF